MLCRDNETSVPADVARGQVALAIDLVVQLARDAGGGRRVVEIVEVAGVDRRGQYRLRPLFQSQPVPGTTGGGSRLESTGERPSFADEAIALGYADPTSGTNRDF
jgi:hypothetical protein